MKVFFQESFILSKQSLGIWLVNKEYAAVIDGADG